jgi:hypothetical protein
MIPGRRKLSRKSIANARYRRRRSAGGGMRTRERTQWQQLREKIQEDSKEINQTGRGNTIVGRYRNGGRDNRTRARIQEAQAGISAIFPPDMLEDTLPTDMENTDVNPDLCARIVEECKNLNVGTSLRTISDNLERINAASTAMLTLSEMQEFLGQNLDEATVKPLLNGTARVALWQGNVV